MKIDMDKVRAAMWESRREARSLGYDWDVADAMAALESVLLCTSSTTEDKIDT